MQLGPTWQEVVAFRRTKEDEIIRKKFEPYAYLGRGHMRPDLCRQEILTGYSVEVTS